MEVNIHLSNLSDCFENHAQFQLSFVSPGKLRKLENFFFFFGFEDTSPLQKTYFVGPGKGVKPRLS